MRRAEPTIWSSLCHWWIRERESKNAVDAARNLARIFWEFARESTPERRRRRYGDAEYDWARRVNTTSGGVGAHSRFLGLLHSEYQPIEAEIFRDIMERLLDHLNSSSAPDSHSRAACATFTFVDIGSGKGRALLLAAEHPFRRIIGIELLPELHAIAKQNVADLHARESLKSAVELQCGDAAQFSFPLEPLVVFVFNPLPEAGLRKVVTNLERSLRELWRPIFVIYVNPVHEEIVSGCSGLRKFAGTHQYSVFESRR